MVSLAIAGAGTQAVGWILGVAGASRTVLDVQIPYASSAVVDYVGFELEQFVSVETSRALARAAYFRAVCLRSGNTPVAGVACTATIATDRLKRGEHRCHVAVHCGTGYSVSSLTLAKGRRDRTGEDDVVSRLILNAIAEFAAIDGRVDPGLLEGEYVSRDSIEFSGPFGGAFGGPRRTHRCRLGRDADGGWEDLVGVCSRGRSIHFIGVTSDLPGRPQLYLAGR